MATDNNKADFIIDRRVFEIAQQTIASGAGDTTLYFSVDPRMSASIQVTKNSETATISVTNQFHSSGDLENAGTKWVDVESSTTDYIAGDSRGLVGIKINANPAAGDVEVSILQYREKSLR